MGKLQSAWAHFWGTKGKIAGEEKETRRNLGRLEDKLAIDATSLSCAICCCVYAEPPKLLPCGHSLCCVCVPQMKSSEFVNYGSCPFCRTPFRPDRLVKNFALETVLDGVTTEIEDLYKDAVNRGVRPSVTGETDNIAFR